MLELAYLKKLEQKQPALLKAECADFIVREKLGYEMSGDGEFVALLVRKTDANTLFVGEKLAQFAGISPKNMSYAGLKDRKAITEQWFCLQMPGMATPDFSQFQLDGVEILQVTRHQRKIRIGSLDGNEFEILLRGMKASAELEQHLTLLAEKGFPNYFTEQRFGRDGHNLTQATAWAKGEIKVKDRKKRSFYLSAARSEVFNLVLSARLSQELAEKILVGDLLQLAGSHSWFIADENQDFSELQQRLAQGDIQLTGPLIGENSHSASEIENQIVEQYKELLNLMKQERVKASRRPLLVKPENLQWQFEDEGLRLKFYLPAGSYATALVREIALVDEQN